MDSSVLFFSIVAVVIGGGFLMLLGKFRFREQNSSPSSSLSISSVPLSSLSRPTQTYHVFPSFGGQDVRRDFFSHIQTEFQREGITLFIDNNITRGEPIGPELLLAVRASKIAIILLSRSYASSQWCLDELVEIMKCREEFGQTVIPIFYGVDPSDVKNLAGDFGKVFRETCAGNTEEDAMRWKHALEEVAIIAGYHSTNWDNEATMIKQMARDISDKLKNSTLSCYFNGLVGMRAYLVKMETLVGLCSIAGSAYNKLPSSSQLSDFMENVKAKYTRPCSLIPKWQLQQQFMPRITNHKDIRICRSGADSNWLKANEVLVVLDGVDHLVKLNGVAKETLRFGPSSQITIRARGSNHTYEVDFLQNHEALQMLCMYAYGQNSPNDGFDELARKVTGHAGRLPLGLRVLGAYLRGMSWEGWTELLLKLMIRLIDNIESTLKFTYDALEDEDKDLFLHIACLNHNETKRVEENLANKFSNVKQRLQLLAEKSLIIVESEQIRMHDSIKQLATKIVHKRQVLLSKL